MKVKVSKPPLEKRVLAKAEKEGLSRKFYVTIKDGQTIIERPEAIIDSIRILPSGRGKFTKIVDGHTIPKSKTKFQKNPNRLSMVFIKGNPCNINLVLYKNNYQKTGQHFSTVLFAGKEAVRLSSEQIDDFLFSLIAIKKLKNEQKFVTLTCPKLMGNLQRIRIRTSLYGEMRFRGKSEKAVYEAKIKRIVEHFEEKPKKKK